MELKLRDFTENNFWIILEIVYIQSLIVGRLQFIQIKTICKINQ